MTAHIDELDRLIDALNGQRDLEEDGPVVGELQELVELASGLKALGHTQWPDESFPFHMAVRLAARLDPDSTPAIDVELSGSEKASEFHALPPLPRLDDQKPPIPPNTRRSWLRRSLEIAAAVVVLAAFTGLVSMLLRGSGTGTASPTAQVGQSTSSFSLAALKDLNDGIVQSVDDAGNGRYLHLVKTGGGYTVSVDWAGTTLNHVLVAVTMEPSSASPSSYASPFNPKLTTADGSALTSMGIGCKQTVCLLRFDRTPIEKRTGEIALHLDIPGLHVGSAPQSARNVGTPDVAADFAFDFSLPAWSNGEATSTAQTAPTSTPVSTAVAAEGTPVQTSDPTLIALQQAAGFDLFYPSALPNGLTLEQPKPPMSLPGFTSVVLKYVDADGKEALTITEASPYQESAQTMPTDIWNNAIPVEIQSDGYGRVRAKLYQSKNDVQMWWQVGKTSIRLESGGAPGTTMLQRDLLVAAATSMQRVGASGGSVVATPKIPADAKVKTTGEAVTKARTVIQNLGGNTDATASSVALAVLQDQTALGMPRPNGVDANAPIWVVTFDNALSPQGCPQAGESVCQHGQLVVVVDAQSGTIFGFHGFDGAWREWR